MSNPLSSKNIPTQTVQEVGAPSMLRGLEATGFDTKEFRVRVDRFVIDEENSDSQRLEDLYTRGVDGSGSVVILEQKSFTFEANMVFVVTYLEKRPVADPNRVLESLSRGGV